MSELGFASFTLVVATLLIVITLLPFTILTIMNIKKYKEDENYSIIEASAKIYIIQFLIVFAIAFVVSIYEVVDESDEYYDITGSKGAMAFFWNTDFEAKAKAVIDTQSSSSVSSNVENNWYRSVKSKIEESSSTELKATYYQINTIRSWYELLVSLATITAYLIVLSGGISNAKTYLSKNNNANALAVYGLNIGGGIIVLTILLAGYMAITSVGLMCETDYLMKIVQDFWASVLI